MIYGSVCSGIEAASVAWENLRWKAAWFSEINPFCNRVLEHHWPNVKNLGSLTEIRKNSVFQSDKIDLLVGGTPCQAFSLAGDREGLDDPRGDLTLEYIRCIEAKRPRWFIWENVPGVLSIEGGRVFGTILREMVKFGYGVAYRVLDAKDFGLPQNRPRVFVIGHSSGDGQIPSRVLGITATCNNYAEGSNNETGRIPTLTLRNAGNNNARGVSVVESFMQGKRPDGPVREDSGWEIRSLTPWEEERRQGFSGNHTKIDGASDSERYASIGNSMAVPVMRWIGEQIQKEEDAMAKRTKPEDIEKMKTLKEGGKSLKDIAFETGFSYATVNSKLKPTLLDITPVSDAAPLTSGKTSEDIIKELERQIQILREAQRIKEQYK